MPRMNMARLRRIFPEPWQRYVWLIGWSTAAMRGMAAAADDTVLAMRRLASTVDDARDV
jgi:hypothetical protein